MNVTSTKNEELVEAVARAMHAATCKCGRDVPLTSYDRKRSLAAIAVLRGGR